MSKIRSVTKQLQMAESTTLPWRPGGPSQAKTLKIIFEPQNGLNVQIILSNFRNSYPLSPKIIEGFHNLEYLRK